MSRPFDAPLIPPIPPMLPFPKVPPDDYDFKQQKQVIETKALGGSGTSGPYPFDVEITGTGTITCSVRIGVLNNIIPSDFTDTYAFADNVTRYLVLTATATDGAITGCSLSMETTAPAVMSTLQGSPPVSFTLLLGLVVNAVWYRTIGNGSLFATPAEAFRISKTSPAPGTLPYDIYYTWAITNV